MHHSILFVVLQLMFNGESKFYEVKNNNFKTGTTVSKFGEKGRIRRVRLQLIGITSLIMIRRYIIV
jgi:hypothetical protein